MTLLLNIDVPDLAAAERFYVSAFDLKVLRRWTAEIVEMEGWPIRLFLLRKDADTYGAPESTRSYVRHWTPVHFDVVVQDVAAACARAVASGASIDQAPTQTEYGAIAMLADPFGNGFCLLEFGKRGYEAIADAVRTESGFAAAGGGV